MIDAVSQSPPVERAYLPPDEPIDFATWTWLREQGLPAEVLGWCQNLRMLDGKIAFYEPADEDIVLWSARQSSVYSLRGIAFAIGSSELSAGSGVLAPLRIHAGPVEWLKDGGCGIVVADWSQCFDRLRNVPRVAVAPSVLPQYRKAMQPRGPAISVLDYGRAA